MEFVRCRHKRSAGQLRNRGGDLFVKALRRIQTRADRRSAERQLTKLRQGDFQHFLILLQGGAPTADFLGKGDRRRVLQMRSSALDDSLVFRFKAF